MNQLFVQQQQQHNYYQMKNTIRQKIILTLFIPGMGATCANDLIGDVSDKNVVHHHDDDDDGD